MLSKEYIELCRAAENAKRTNVSDLAANDEPCAAQNSPDWHELATLVFWPLIWAVAGCCYAALMAMELS